VHADAIQASGLSPDIAMVVLAPVRARLDNGELMLRADPDLDVDTFTNLAGFPATGLTTKLYRALDTGLVYRWTGTAYVLTDDFAPVRLVAQTAVLGLPVGTTLNYRIDFDHVTFNEADQELPSFAVAAPTSDIVLDLTTAARASF
jgi:hypothetical protein